MGARAIGMTKQTKAPVSLTQRADGEGGTVTWQFRKPLTKLDADGRRQALLELATALRAVADDVEQALLEMDDSWE